ncbi:MAG: hypothetical protein L0229_15650 [Blastocatellia bacterium]|nr:hypothetical protein [Blastocatellia bacterium]
MKTMIVLMALGLLSAFPSSARMARQDSQVTVEKVEIRGNRRITEEAIKSRISTLSGSAYDPARLNRDLRAINATGHFHNVNLLVEDGPQGGKVVTFEVEEWPLISDVIFQGLDSTRQARVLEELRKHNAGVSKRSTYSPAKVRVAARIIEDFLVREGHKGVKVTPLIQSGSATEVIVKFEVRFRSSR